MSAYFFTQQIIVRFIFILLIYFIRVATHNYMTRKHSYYDRDNVCWESAISVLFHYSVNNEIYNWKDIAYTHKTETGDTVNS